MKLIVTGTDANGDSMVAEERDISPGAASGPLYSSENLSGIAYKPRPDVRDLGVAPGAAFWRMAHLPGNWNGDSHYTDTVDFCQVHTGSVDIILDSGPVRLEPGDCVLLQGDRHGWHSDDGATMSIVNLGVYPGAATTA